MIMCTFTRDARLRNSRIPTSDHGPDGSFTLGPPGIYTLEAWHEVQRPGKK
jgi:hypothetical protein